MGEQLSSVANPMALAFALARSVCALELREFLASRHSRGCTPHLQQLVEFSPTSRLQHLLRQWTSRSQVLDEPTHIHFCTAARFRLLTIYLIKFVLCMQYADDALTCVIC